MELDLASTKELIAQLETRLDTCLVLGITVDNNILTYHRSLRGMNQWALMTPLVLEIEGIKHNFHECPEAKNPPVNF